MIVLFCSQCGAPFMVPRVLVNGERVACQCCQEQRGDPIRARVIASFNDGITPSNLRYCHSPLN